LKAAYIVEYINIKTKLFSQNEVWDTSDTVTFARMLWLRKLENTTNNRRSYSLCGVS